MGGSSLAPDILRETFGTHRRLSGTARARLDRSRSKSRNSKRSSTSTARSSSSRARAARRRSPMRSLPISTKRSPRRQGADKAGSQFVAITDPGTKLVEVAHGVTSSAASSTTIPTSAAAIPRCRISGCCRRRSRATTSIFCSIAASAQCMRTIRPSTRKSRPGLRFGAAIGGLVRTGATNSRSSRIPQIRGVRRVGRTTDRGVHRKTRQRHRADRRRGTRRPDGVRRRPRLRVRRR